MEPEAFLLASRPGAFGLRHHLFRRAGERSLCGLFSWLQVEHVRAPYPRPPWICAGCLVAARGIDLVAGEQVLERWAS